MSETGSSSRPAPRSRRRHVLDDEPDILHAVAPHQRALARQAATAPVLLLEAGPAPLQEWFAEPLGGPGLLVLQGMLAREVTVGGRTATELLGPGDMLRPWDVRAGEPVPSGIDWLVLTTTQLALLDRVFAERTRAWPPIADAFMARLARRAQAIAVQRAIASHPRVDMRVALLLWHLAGRWGTVQRDREVRFTLPLTHKLLGELVSAERPTVSHALGRLSRAGLLRRCGAEWYLRGTPEDHAAVACRPLPPRRVSAHTAAVAASARR
jgi:CRP-like cAMP-binding protein